MKISLLVIGDELLTGEIDPYPEEIISLVREKHQNIQMIEMVGDVKEEIISCIENAKRIGTDQLIITGGLGPTLDDITREVVAEYLEEELIVDQEMVRAMEDALTRMHGKPMRADDIRSRMARVPKGAKPLKNITGAACGIEAYKNGMRIFCLPGFPNESLPMFKEYILPMIEDGGICEEEISVWQGEATLEPLFEEIVGTHNVRLASLPSIDWHEKGNKVVIKGEREQVDAAFAHFQRLLDQHGWISSR